MIVLKIKDCKIYFITVSYWSAVLLFNKVKCQNFSNMKLSEIIFFILGWLIQGDPDIWLKKVIIVNIFKFKNTWKILIRSQVCLM